MKELYKQTFSHLHASGNAFQEAGQMKTGRIRKSLVIGAAAAALMATAAGAFFAHILSFTIPGGVDNVSYNDDGTITFQVEDGAYYTVTGNKDTDHAELYFEDATEDEIAAAEKNRSRSAE